MNNTIKASKEQIADFNTIVSFLAKRDIDILNSEKLNKKYGFKQADLLIVLGNSIPYIAEKAATAFKGGIAKKLMIVGGIGHSTQYLRDNVESHAKYKNIETINRAEADILTDILEKFYFVNSKDLLVENQSTNCGDNAEKAYEKIIESNISYQSIILMQDPTMQLRSFASFKKVWNSNNKESTFINFAPFIPYIDNHNEFISFKNNDIHGLWDIKRFLSLVMGEIPRLSDNQKGYGPKGKNYIIHIDVPTNVISAYKRLLPKFTVYSETRKISFSHESNSSPYKNNKIEDLKRVLYTNEKILQKFFTSKEIKDILMASDEYNELINLVNLQNK